MKTRNPLINQETPESGREASSAYLDRLVEIYKARLTLLIALIVAVVSLTGYAYQNDRADLFFLAAIIPGFGLLIDVFIKREVACPFLYKALLADSGTNDSEAITALFLDFRRANKSKYSNILESNVGEERRRKFRKAYVTRGLWLKAILAVLASGLIMTLGVAHLK